MPAGAWRSTSLAARTTTVPATLREHTPALAAAAAAVKTLSHATLVYPASALRFQQPYATSRMSIFHSHLRAPARAVLTCRCEVSAAAIKSATSPLSDCYYHLAARSPPPNAACCPSIAPTYRSNV
ncbi:hypothetical protein B0H10DRAFT_2231963 [Mycena sp. CBHHK59/15]|nr:hypothetical protein B0H10DRAFT_2234979 [Mycena sp. CBHHK59/15]KAJ6597828.1 hypothetical protein B0H10DRAFT_2231963 [Mycena sp. CBHHK59/15]